MRARNVSVSLYQQGGELHVWCARFDIKGSVAVPTPKADGTVDWAPYWAAIAKKEKEIAKILASVEFPDA